MSDALGGGDAATSPPFPLVELAPELLERVIHFVAVQGSLREARALATVARAWVTPALRVAWSSLSLSNYKHGATANASSDPPRLSIHECAWRFDEGIPAWTRHVRTLVLALRAEPHLDDGDGSEEEMAHTLTQMMGACARVRSLELMLSGDAGRLLEYPNVI